MRSLCPRAMHISYLTNFLFLGSFQVVAYSKTKLPLYYIQVTWLPNPNLEQYHKRGTNPNPNMNTSRTRISDIVLPLTTDPDPYHDAKTNDLS